MKQTYRLYNEATSYKSGRWEGERDWEFGIDVQTIATMKTMPRKRLPLKLDFCGLRAASQALVVKNRPPMQEAHKGGA